MPHNTLNETIDALQSGAIIVYPTDTQYALGGVIDSTTALFKIFSLKQRPLGSPLPIGVSDLQMMEHVAKLTPLAKTLASHFLPGPLTLILTHKNTLPPTLHTPNKTIAIRIPDHPVALELLQSCGPLTITSANIHGKEAYDIPTILSQLKSSLTTIDVGPLQSKPSTIIDARGPTPKLIREGILPFSTIMKAIDNE